jgi:hypothetical protein
MQGQPNIKILQVFELENTITFVREIVIGSMRNAVR